MKIIKVTPENITDFNKEVNTPNIIAFVKIFSKDCHFCKELQPKWEQLEKEMEQDNKEGILASLSVNDVDDAKINTDTRGVPTIRVYQGGKMKFDYEGKRETADMKFFLGNLLKKQKGGGRKRKTRKRRKSRKQYGKGAAMKKAAVENFLKNKSSGSGESKSQSNPPAARPPAPRRPGPGEFSFAAPFGGKKRKRRNKKTKKRKMRRKTRRKKQKRKTRRKKQKRCFKNKI